MTHFTAGFLIDLSIFSPFEIRINLSFSIVVGQAAKMPIFDCRQPKTLNLRVVKNAYPSPNSDYRNRELN